LSSQNDNLPADHFANDTKKIAAQYFFQVSFRVPSIQQGSDQRRHLGHILQAVRRTRDAIEIAPNAHVVDSRDPYGVVDVIGYVLYRRRDFGSLPK